jgi:hypothetical protein
MGEMMHVSGIGEKGNLKGMFGGECLRLKSSRGSLSNGLNLESLRHTLCPIQLFLLVT